MHRSPIACAVAALSFVSIATAQKMPDPRDNSRVVQLHDAAEWVKQASPGTVPGLDGLSNEDRGLLAAARFARSFCEPAMSDEEDVSVVAHRYLVAIARPEQQVWIEGWLKAVADAPDGRLALRVRQFKMSEGYFGRVVEPLLKDAVRKPLSKDGRTKSVQGRVDAADVAAIDKAFAEAEDVIAGPLLSRTMRPLTIATAREGKTIPYVRDFDVEIGGAAKKPQPIHDVVFDGLEVDVVCGWFADGDIGVSLRAATHDVLRPIPTFKTNVGGKKVVIELPSKTVRSGEWNVKVPTDGYGVCVFGEPGSRTAFVVDVKRSKQVLPQILLPPK